MVSSIGRASRGRRLRTAVPLSLFLASASGCFVDSQQETGSRDRVVAEDAGHPTEGRGFDLGAFRESAPRGRTVSCEPDDLQCEILDDDCQRRVLRTVQCLGGFEAAELPQIRTLELARYEEELREVYSDAEAEPGNARWDAALRLLGLLPRAWGATDAATARAQRTVAFYDAAEDEVTLIDRGSGAGPSDVRVLAHELAHALRYAATTDLLERRRSETTTDRRVALSSLVEGEASILEHEVTKHAAGETPDTIDWIELARTSLVERLRSLSRSDDVYGAAVSSLPYAIGVARLGPIWRQHGRAVTDSMFDAPDLSLLSWLQADAANTQVLDCYPMVPPAGYVAEWLDVLGPMGVLALPLALGTRTSEEAFSEMTRWRNDWLVTFRSADLDDGTSVAAAWRIRFAAPSDALAFAEDIEGRIFGRSTVTVAGSEVVVLTASDAELAGTWTMHECLERADVNPDWAAAAAGL
jgi:hypothetical protein